MKTQTMVAALTAVVVRNVTMEGVMVPLFVRTGARKKWGGVITGNGEHGTGNGVSDVLIENVAATGGCWTASSITGVPGQRTRNVTLRNVSIVVPGGADAALVSSDVPEKEKTYPDANMFETILPAHGLYIRHTDDVRLENVTIMPLTPDPRPAIFSDDATVSKETKENDTDEY